MFACLKSDPASPSGWTPFDAPANGGTNFSGDAHPEVLVRHTERDGKIMAGEYRQRAGAFDVHWIFTEHAFVLEGELELTDLDTGKKVTLGPGDGWTIPAGTRTRWNVAKDGFRKSFLLVYQ
ncbi:hypothetical protein DFJ74DRAFT_681204 [Hyaloraphidium curvatum]|nr:hypothetical protein DFJ74DRAFT_681204 [Hyaloraphidium curvatum]